MVPSKVTRQFQGFEIKNYNIYDEKFEQPIFGSNYFHGHIKADGIQFTNDLQFKVWFKSGNQAQFLNKWFSAKKVSQNIFKRSKTSPAMEEAHKSEEVNSNEEVV